MSIDFYLIDTSGIVCCRSYSIDDYEDEINFWNKIESDMISLKSIGYNVLRVEVL